MHMLPDHMHTNAMIRMSAVVYVSLLVFEYAYTYLCIHVHSKLKY